MKTLIVYKKILHQNYTEVPYNTMMDKQEVWAFAEHILARLKGEIQKWVENTNIKE